MDMASRLGCVGGVWCSVDSASDSSRSHVRRDVDTRISYVAESVCGARRRSSGMVGAVFVVSPADPYHRTPLVGMASATQ